jgi:hypothetical protein
VRGGGGGTVLDRWVIDPSADWDWNGAAAACVGDAGGGTTVRPAVESGSGHGCNNNSRALSLCLSRCPDSRERELCVCVCEWQGVTTGQCNSGRQAPQSVQIISGGPTRAVKRARSKLRPFPQAVTPTPH